jgi:hypothetical protein
VKALSLKDLAARYFSIAKTMLRVDGYHHPMALLFLPEGQTCIGSIGARNQTEKFVLWERIAADVEVAGAEKLIHISEVWAAPIDPHRPERPAKESPERREALGLTAACMTGEEVAIHCFFTRTADGIEFEDDLPGSTIAASFLEPVRRVWAKRR